MWTRCIFAETHVFLFFVIYIIILFLFFILYHKYYIDYIYDFVSWQECSLLGEVVNL